MAHLEKFSAGAMGGLCIHYDRKTMKHANEEIDVSRAHLNYDLRNNSDGLDTRSRFEKRLKEVYCMKRKDVKPFATWVITLPSELKEKNTDEQRVFFEKTYEFLENRYGGEKNVLSANVHNDETTPHMHFVFMPVIWDAKKAREKVSAKEVLNRKELQTFHQDLDDYLKTEIPHIYQCGILNDKTIGIDDVKLLKKQNEAITVQKKEIEKEAEEVHALKRQLKAEKAALLQKSNEIKQKQQTLEKLDKKYALAYEVNQYLKDLEKNAGRTMLGKMVLSKKEFSELSKFMNGVAKSGVRTSEQREKLEKENAMLSRENDVLKNNEAYNKHTLKKNLEQINKLTDKVEQLEYQKSVVADYVFALRSVLSEYRSFNLSEEEQKVHLILYKIENNHAPSSIQTCKSWDATLRKHAEKINPSRLKNAFEKLKAWLSELLNKEQSQNRRKNREYER